jgi:hypothetical protein
LFNPSKSGFFLRFGYSIQEWSRLRDDILTLARSYPLMFERETEYGKKYAVRGEIKTPDGGVVQLSTIWMSEPGQPTVLRFLTA